MLCFMCVLFWALLIPNNPLGCLPEKEPAQVVFRRAETTARFMSPSDICKRSLTNARAKIVKIRQKCK